MDYKIFTEQLKAANKTYAEHCLEFFKQEGFSIESIMPYSSWSVEAIVKYNSVEVRLVFAPYRHQGCYYSFYKVRPNTPDERCMGKVSSISGIRKIKKQIQD